MKKIKLREQTRDVQYEGPNFDYIVIISSIYLWYNFTELLYYSDYNYRERKPHRNSSCCTYHINCGYELREKRLAASRTTRGSPENFDFSD